MRISDWSSDVCSSDLLLADYGAVIRQTGSDRRLNPRAHGLIRRHVGDAAVRDDGRTFRARALIIGEHLLLMLTRDERAEAGRFVVGMPRPERFCFRLESTDEPVEQRALDEDALGSEAHLTTVEEHRTHDA